MYYLYVIVGVAVMVSFAADRRKTFKALRETLKRLLKILPAMLLMLILVSFLPIQLSDANVFEYLRNDNKTISVLLASLLGSITMLPGFIAFPLSGILLQKGIPYMVISAFTTTLMMVGIVTYPVEKVYLGHKVTVLRNVISFGIALIVALVTGIVFGEVW